MSAITTKQSMKKATYILSIIILSLLSLGATAQTQNEELKLCIYPYDISVCGFLYEIVPQKYLKDINGIKRDNQSVIHLKNERDFYSKIRIETDKGRISCSFKPKNYLINLLTFRITDVTDIVKLKEGEHITTANMWYWKINRLNKKDKEITIKAYLNKTNELIGQKTYKLNPDTMYVYTPRLSYTDLDGNKRTVDRRLNDLPINRNIPMQLVVDDGWGNIYRPIGNVTLQYPSIMYNTLPNLNQNPDSIFIRNDEFFISDIAIITKDSSLVRVEPIVK